MWVNVVINILFGVAEMFIYFFSTPFLVQTQTDPETYIFVYVAGESQKKPLIYAMC